MVTWLFIEAGGPHRSVPRRNTREMGEIDHQAGHIDERGAKGRRGAGRIEADPLQAFRPSARSSLGSSNTSAARSNGSAESTAEAMSMDFVLRRSTMSARCLRTIYSLICRLYLALVVLNENFVLVKV